MAARVRAWLLLALFALDKQYASFLSRYKTYAFDPGRNFIVRVTTDF